MIVLDEFKPRSPTVAVRRHNKRSEVKVHYYPSYLPPDCTGVILMYEQVLLVSVYKVLLEVTDINKLFVYMKHVEVLKQWCQTAAVILFPCTRS